MHAHLSVAEHEHEIETKIKIDFCAATPCTQPADQCQENLCDSSSGAAVCAGDTLKTTGTACDDSNANTGSDMCDAGGNCVGTGNKTK